ncbi:MAG: Crp/Fnr family transcriptional regulator [Parafilimonas sp.]
MKINDNSAALLRFRNKIEALRSISDKDFEGFTDLMHEKHFSKGATIFSEGQVCYQFYFIFSGCIRRYGLKDGREVNVDFYIEDDIACDFESFRREIPSKFYFVAMEDCVTYYAVKKEVIPFFRHSTSMHMLLFRFFQDLYFRQEDHSNNFKLLSPEERYKYLMKNNPQYLQRIPVVHLASYLGMSRETVNRIRKKLS